MPSTQGTATPSPTSAGREGRARVSRRRASSLGGPTGPLPRSPRRSGAEPRSRPASTALVTSAGATGTIGSRETDRDVGPPDPRPDDRPIDDDSTPPTALIVDGAGRRPTPGVRPTRPESRRRHRSMPSSGSWPTWSGPSSGSATAPTARCETCGGRPSTTAELERRPGHPVLLGPPPARAWADAPPARSPAPAGREVRPFLVSQKILSISAIWSSRSSATLTSFVFLASPAVLVAFQKRSCSCGVLLQVLGLEVVGPQDPQVVLDQVGPLLLDEDGPALEDLVVRGVELLHAPLHRLGLDAGLGRVVDAAGEVAVGVGRHRGGERSMVESRRSTMRMGRTPSSRVGSCRYGRHLTHGHRTGEPGASAGCRRGVLGARLACRRRRRGASCGPGGWWSRDRAWSPPCDRRPAPRGARRPVRGSATSWPCAIPGATGAAAREAGRRAVAGGEVVVRGTTRREHRQP